MDSVIFTFRQGEDGTCTCSDPYNNHGFLISEEMLDAIIESCKRDKRKYKGEMRELMNLKIEKQQDERHKIRMNEMKNAIKTKTLAPRQEIYLIKDTIRGFIKIGIGRCAKSRLKTLKTANPSIEMLSFFNGSQHDERILHQHFKSKNKHVGGEWFNLNEDDLTDVNNYFAEKELPF